MTKVGFENFHLHGYVLISGSNAGQVKPRGFLFLSCRAVVEATPEDLHKGQDSQG